jgi:hypothetical protein
MCKQSAAARQQRASARAADIAPPIAELQADGATSLRQIAAGLNATDIPTARGEGAWTAPQVKRVLKQLVGWPAFAPDSKLGPGVNPRHRRSAGPLYSFPLGRRKGRPQNFLASLRFEFSCSTSPVGGDGAKVHPGRHRHRCARTACRSAPVSCGCDGNDGERTSGLRIGELGEIESAAGERDRLGAGRDRAVRSEEAISEIVMVLAGVLTYRSKGR